MRGSNLCLDRVQVHGCSGLHGRELDCGLSISAKIRDRFVLLIEDLNIALSREKGNFLIQPLFSITEAPNPLLSMAHSGWVDQCLHRFLHWVRG